MPHNSNIPPKPDGLVVIPENIPIDLTTLNQWLIWRYFYKPDLGYFDKRSCTSSLRINAMDLSVAANMACIRA